MFKNIFNIGNINAGKVTINGVTYSGNDISIKNNKVYIDGVIQNVDTNKTNEIRIEVAEGSIVNINCDENIICGDISGNISAGGDITCLNVSGSINAGGDVSAFTVHGNITAGGDVSRK